MSRYIKDSAGKLVKFADKFMKMANHIYNEGIYYLRVKAGGGTVQDREMVEDIYKVYEENNMLDNIRVGVLAQAGGVQRTSGIYRFFSKLFTLRTDANDVIQSTANSQPYFVNGALVNPNGASRFMTHPNITYTASDSWTVSFILNWNGTINAIAGLIGKGSDTASILSLRLASNNRFSIISEGAATVSGTIGNTNKLIGKDTYVQFKANGTQLQIFIDTVLIETLTANTAIVFSSLIKAYSTASRDFNGSIKYYLNYNGLMTSGQSTAEYTVLRKYFPEIRTTLIGSKEIATENCQMVATPMGRVISQNDLAGNVERYKIDFEGGLIGTKSDIAPGVSTWELNTLDPISGTQDAKLTITTVGVGDSRPFVRFSHPPFIIGKVYKFSFKYRVLSGIVKIKQINLPSAIAVNLELTGAGTYITYFTASAVAANLDFYFDGRTLYSCQFDDIITEEVGFAGASDLYTAIYNQTVGTVEQKTSAALAAAAMWRSPDADHDKQAVFGKVFNKFATKLMAFDIAAYNTANPSTPWGYHVMTRAESLALQALDADTLKATGTDYWTTANGTNTTGLNLLGSGVINADGTYSDFKGKTRLMTDDDYAIDINDDGTATEIAVTTEGGILRLVKD